MCVVRREVRAEKHQNGEGVDESRLNEDADNMGQFAAPTDARQALGDDAVIDTEDAVHDQA